MPFTQSPAIIDGFRFVISNLQAEVESLKQRIEKLERTLKKEKTKEKGSWINRMFK